MVKKKIEAVIYGTGLNTFFGRTAELVEKTQTRSHFQKAVLQIGNYLIVIALILVVLIVGVAIFRDDPILTTLLFALVLTIAAVPVAIPTVLSVTMAVGARFLGAKQAIVSRLASIEELAGIDVLCSDKTGTLTQSKLTTGDCFSIQQGNENEVMIAAALASREENQDPIDLAVIAGVKDKNTLNRYKNLKFSPFDPVKKRTEALIEEGDRTFRVSKWAIQVIIDLAKPDEESRKKINKTVEEFAARGFRSLGVAKSETEGTWKILGVIPLFDPLRPDSAPTIDTAKKMGISVKMVTGDQIAIAKETAKNLGLGINILDANKFSETGYHKASLLADDIEKSDGFAQVFPEHKYHIVEVLQSKNHIVGMTGDGVNDAPALKKADVGIAVSGSTDAARAAADIVLVGPGLSVIIDAIETSRKIFHRMTSYTTYRIAETIRVLLFMTLSILVFNFYPVTAVMIVLLALLNDGAILSIAFDRAPRSDSPLVWEMHTVLGIATILGLMGVIASFGLFYFGERIFHLNREFIQTLMYLKLSVAGHLTIFVTRTKGHFWSHRPSAALLFAVIGTQIVATFISIFGIFMTPIGWFWALVVWGYAIFWFIINDFVKYITFKIFENHRKVFGLPKRTRKGM